ncbi:hypothetical protein D3C86_2115100 [compost metagenome]
MGDKKIGIVTLKHDDPDSLVMDDAVRKLGKFEHHQERENIAWRISYGRKKNASFQVHAEGFEYICHVLTTACPG